MLIKPNLKHGLEGQRNNDMQHIRHLRYERRALYNGLRCITAYQLINANVNDFKKLCIKLFQIVLT
jgi:hypothetical protein